MVGRHACPHGRVQRALFAGAKMALCEQGPAPPWAPVHPGCWYPARAISSCCREVVLSAKSRRWGRAASQHFEHGRAPFSPFKNHPETAHPTNRLPPPTAGARPPARRYLLPTPRTALTAQSASISLWVCEGGAWGRTTRMHRGH